MPKAKRGHLEDYEKQLLDGAEGEEVMKKMKKSNGQDYELSALRRYISAIRTNIVKQLSEKNIRHPDYSLDGLQRYADEEKVKEFMNGSLKVQHEMQRRAMKLDLSTGARRTIKAIQLLPDNVAAFKLNDEQNKEVKQKAEEALSKKLELPIVINNTTGLLKEAEWLLENATAKTPLNKIAIPLLLMSGRRMSEIYSTRSTFTEANPHAAMFTGQLKKPNGESSSYVIPLLCKFKVFDTALKLLRERIDILDEKAKESAVKKGVPPRKPTSELSEDEIKKRYQPNMCEDMKKEGENRILTNLPNRDMRDTRGVTAHDLRGIYAKIVYECFENQMAFPKVCEKILGHEGPSMSLNYSHIKIENYTPKVFGELP